MKKILLVLIVLLLIPCMGFADDGSMLDLKERLTHTIEFDVYECELGGTIDYKLKIKNLNSKEIKLQNIFSNDSYVEYREDSKIGAGQTAIFNISDVKVMPYYQWYQKEDGYYFDMQINYDYELGTWEDDFYADYFCVPYKTTSLKINNLNDGSDYIEVSGIDTIGFVDFREWDLKYNDDNIHIFGSGKSTQTALITNISDKEIQLVTGKYGEVILTPLKPGQSIEQDIMVNTIADRSKPARNSELLSFNVTFMMDNKYYGVSNQRVYKSRYFPFNADLKFDVTVFDGDYKSLDDEYAFYKIDIVNKGMDISEFKYIISDQNVGHLHEYGERDLYKEDFFDYGTLKKGETIAVYTRLKKNADIFGCFAVGDAITNAWEYYELGTSGKETDYYYLYYDAREFGDKQDDNGEVEEDIQQAENMGENEPTKEVMAEKPKSTQAPQVLKVVKIETKSSMPIWVGIVLGFALLGTVIIIFILRKKQD